MFNKVLVLHFRELSPFSHWFVKCGVEGDDESGAHNLLPPTLFNIISFMSYLALDISIELLGTIGHTPRINRLNWFNIMKYYKPAMKCLSITNIKTGLMTND